MMMTYKVSRYLCLLCRRIILLLMHILLCDFVSKRFQDFLVVNSEGIYLGAKELLCTVETSSFNSWKCGFFHVT
ncbi:hypothetical protein L1987_80677 [Smallanthus sonchifolius]|uniref:Uncharacterized protein n=1 Tax=Smallanthus sonchifolius TaxID=185202 RepID=A0ACB8YNA2_9ASTR|nr:hypothetical protein L1987_80677 [Smallanthus sonchifolius]